MHRDSLSHVRAGAISGGSWRKLQAARMGLWPEAQQQSQEAGAPQGHPMVAIREFLAPDGS